MTQFDVVYRLRSERARRTIRLEALDGQQARRRARAALGADITILRVHRVAQS